MTEQPNIQHPKSNLATVSTFFQGTRRYVLGLEDNRYLRSSYSYSRARVYTLREAENLVNFLKSSPILKHCHFVTETLDKTS